MSARLFAVILTFIASTGWCESVAPKSAFIFIEQKPPSTSKDKTAVATAVYLNEKGLVQRYVCEDYQIKEWREGCLPAADIFKTLSAVSLKSLPARQEADPNLPPSQAQPGHARIMVRQSGGAEFLWEGDADNIPSALKKLAQDASALALKLSEAHTSELAGKLKTVKSPACNPSQADRMAGRSAGVFVRADILSADRLDEYRVNKLLKTVNSPDELDAVLKEALGNPFCLIPVPAGKNPFSAFSIKGESSSLPLLYNGTGCEISRYSAAPSPSP